MKKVVVFIVAILYLSLTTGLAVNIHYCMGKVSQVQFESYSDKDLCKTQMPCCGHDYHLVKVTDEHQPTLTDLNLKTPVVELYLLVPSIDEFVASTAAQKNITNANSPPLLTDRDICIQNCLFRI
jgi:hypothetical protein